MAHEEGKGKMASQELMVMRQRRLLKRWLRYAENLKATEEKMIDHCWPETGKVSMIGMMKRMNWDRLRISSTARRAEKKKFLIARWAREQR
jgi:hypothetical protein